MAQFQSFFERARYDLLLAEEHQFFDVLPVILDTYQRFYSGSAWFDGQPNLELLKSALLKVYGPASFANEERRIWRWRWPNSKVEIMLYYQDRFSRTTVTFLNNDI